MTHDPESAFRAYVRAFERLDVQAATPFYHVPCMFLAPQGVFVAPDAATLQAMLGRFMDQLRAQSYRRTELSRLETRTLSSDLAACSGVFARFDDGDREIARLGFTYTMRQSGGSWKIVLAAVHDPLAE